MHSREQATGQTPRITAIPRLAAGGKWRVEAMRALSEPLLLWFTRGQGRITLGGVTRGYGPNMAIFVPPGVMHGFEVGPLVFGSALFFGAQHGLNLPQGPTLLRVRDNAQQVELNLCLDAIGRELVSQKPAAAQAARFYLGLVSVWLERQIALAPPDEAPQKRSAQRLVGRFTAALEREFRSGRTVADYARELGVTPTHLTRVCQITMGRSAKALISDRVLFEARRLLRDTQTPVHQVASDLGFTSAAYFTRAFQHHTGTTPSNFRRS